MKSNFLKKHSSKRKFKLPLSNLKYKLGVVEARTSQAPLIMCFCAEVDDVSSGTLSLDQLVDTRNVDF